MPFLSSGPVASSDIATPTRSSGSSMSFLPSSYPSSDDCAYQSSSTPVCPPTHHFQPSQNTPAAGQPVLPPHISTPIFQWTVLPPPVGLNSEASAYGAPTTSPFRSNSSSVLALPSLCPSSDIGSHQNFSIADNPSNVPTSHPAQMWPSSGQPMSHLPGAPMVSLASRQVLPSPADLEASGYREGPPVVSNGLSMPCPPSYPSSAVGAYHHFLTPTSSEVACYRAAPQVRPNHPSMHMSSQSSSVVSVCENFSTLDYTPTTQLLRLPALAPPSGRWPVLPPPPPPPTVQQHILPPSVHPQHHMASVSMEPPPVSVGPVPSAGEVSPSPLKSSLLASKSILLSSLLRDPSGQATPVAHPPAKSVPFPAQQGFVPTSSIGAVTVMESRKQMQDSSIEPPRAAVQGLVEEFSFLSIGSVPGSADPGIDSKSLPRPLDGDVTSRSSDEIHPLNCHPRYLRLTTEAIPNSQSLLSRWHLPLGAVVHPLAEAPYGEEVPTVNFGPTGIIQCRKCQMHINPYVTFTCGGRKWVCNNCSFSNDVPGNYFSLPDSSGRRCDVDQRPELMKGSVEFVAPMDYMARPPMPPIYFFLIDVSFSAARFRMLEIAVKTIKSCLEELPGFPRTQIGFLTFDSTLHFYNMKSSLTQPQMMVVADLDDIFVPLPDDLLVNLYESRNVVETFLDSLPSMFQDNVNIESAFGSALKAAYMIMSQLGGKLLIFQTTLPSLGIGCLKLRGNDLGIYGTNKEHTLRMSADPFYKQMADDLAKSQIGVNVYVFSDKYSDIATLGTLAKYTGGQVNNYSSSQIDTFEEKFRSELARDLTRKTAWEALMRIQCGKGLQLTAYHGHYMLSSTDLLVLPVMDCDKAFAVQLSLEDAILTSQTVYLQASLVYTSSSGERRVRVHTAAVPVVADLGKMYQHADNGAIVSVMSRLAIEKTMSSTLEEARQTVQLTIVKALTQYRKLIESHHTLIGSRMIYPESLRLLPLYGLALCKSVPLRGSYADVQLDDCSAVGFNMMIFPVERLLKLLYPNLTQINELLMKPPADAEGFKKLSKQLPLTAESLDPTGIYAYDDGFCFVIWFGRMLSPCIIKNLIGDDLCGFSNLSKVSLSKLDIEVSRKLVRILRMLRGDDLSSCHVCYLARQGDQPRESTLLLENLVEDSIREMCSYVDWIQQIHLQILHSA